MSYERVSRLGFVNCYLVAEDDGLTLIDTMITGSSGAIAKAADGLGKPIRRILLTHSHSDHAGSVDALVAKLGDVELIVGSREAKLLAGRKSLESGEPDDKLRGGYTKARSTPTRTIEPGDTVGSLEAIAAPGHTPGQLAFLDTRDRTLFCGDAFSTLAGVAVTSKPNPLFPLPYIATWHRPTAFATGEALTGLSPASLAPGHGKVVENPVEQMRAALDRARD